MTNLDEDNLIQEAQGGNLEAFNQLVLVYQGQVYALAYRLLSEPEDAADVAQEAFIAAYRHINAFRKGSFRAWLLRITANLSYDVLRRRKSRPTSPLETLFARQNALGSAGMTAGGAAPWMGVERNELAEEIQRGLQALPPEQRLVVVLCDIEGFGYREAARIAGVSRGTIKSRLSRGRARLRDHFFRRREHLPPSLRSILERAEREKSLHRPADQPEDSEDEIG